VTTVQTKATPEARERADELTPEEFRALLDKGTRSKYGNRRVQGSDGRWFDSMSERDWYEELLWLQREGVISDLECQPVLVLLPKFRRDGEGYKAITYRADFAYNEVGNPRRVIEDVKGARTAVFNIKWKWALHKYPEYDFRLKEV